MGYTIKVKKVNFASVALDKINYTVRIPCTGLALSASTLSFT